MKLGTITAVFLTLTVALPAFACGPGMSPGNTGSANSDPNRQQWTQKRMKHLKQQKQQSSGPGMGTVAISKWQQFNNPMAYTDADAYKAARKKQNLINAIEFLALKKERGQLNPAGQAKLNALINYYRTNYMSGY